MNDFMPWLYQRYIRPYLDEKAQSSTYQMSLSLMENNLMPQDKEIFEQSKEFFAVYAFLLGLHTGAGLEHAL